MNNDSILGQSLGQLSGVVKDTAKQVVEIPAEAAEDIEKQIAGEAKDKNANTQDKQATNGSGSSVGTDEVVKSFYAQSSGEGKEAEDEFRKRMKDKSPEEQKKLLEVRKQFQQLHKQTYYDPTFNPPKKQEERPQEKIEKEEKEKKQMEALELQKKEKKKEELLSVTKGQGTHEKVPGISG